METVGPVDEDIDKNPDFAVVWSFFCKFGKQLELEHVSIQDMVKWFPAKANQSPMAVDVMVKLMRKTGMRVDKQRWQKYLLKATAKQDLQLTADIQANGYANLSQPKKLRALKLLCEMQFDENIKFKAIINGENADDQRLKPVGRNEDGRLYWHQQDEDLNVRIYIEDQDDDDETGWKVACRTKEEIAGLIKKLGDDASEEKAENSDNEEEDVVETQFQKFLKSQCNTEMQDGEESTLEFEQETSKLAKDKNMQKTEDSENMQVDNRTEDVTKTDSLKTKEKYVEKPDNERGNQVETSASIPSQEPNDHDLKQTIPKQLKEEKPNVTNEIPDNIHVSASTENAVSPQDSKTVDSPAIPIVKTEDCSSKGITSDGSSPAAMLPVSQESHPLSDNINKKCAASSGNKLGTDSSSNVMGMNVKESKTDPLTNPNAPSTLNSNTDNVEQTVSQQSELTVGDPNVQSEVLPITSETKESSVTVGDITIKNEVSGTKDDADTYGVIMSTSKTEAQNVKSEFSNESQIPTGSETSTVATTSDSNNIKCSNPLENDTISQNPVSANDTKVENNNSPLVKAEYDCSHASVSAGGNIPDKNKNSTQSEHCEADAIKPNVVLPENELNSEIPEIKATIKSVHHCDSGNVVADKDIPEKSEDSKADTPISSENVSDNHSTPNEPVNRKDSETTKSDVLTMDAHEQSQREESRSSHNIVETKPALSQLSREKPDANSSNLDSNSGYDSPSKNEIESQNPVINPSQSSVETHVLNKNDTKGELGHRPLSDTDETGTTTGSSRNKVCNGEEKSEMEVANNEDGDEKEKQGDGNDGTHRVEDEEDDNENSKSDTTPKKKKKKRRRAAIFRRRPRSRNPASGKNTDQTTTKSPRQRSKPKISRVEQLKMEAESIMQKEKEESKKEDVTYRTRSGRRVKSVKHDQNEPEAWQSIPDEALLKNKVEVEDEDFQYTEHKKRASSKSESDVTPKKRTRKVKDDFPCGKCGLSSHPDTILLCDSCDKGHHMACLTPPLMIVPEDDWFCPNCSKEKLITSLKEIYNNLETQLKLNERKLRQSEHKKLLREYTGISATNIIPEKPKPQKLPKRKKSYSSNSEDDDLSDVDSLLSEPSSPELKSVRSCRTKKVTYDFSNFDKTIRDAIGEVDEPDSSDEKPISGKDIRTIVAAEKGESEANKLLQNSGSAAKRRKRNLTDLNFSDEGAVESGSNYSASSSEGEASEEEFLASDDLGSDDSFKVGLRRSGRRKKRVEVKPVQRSRRLRRKRIQEDYATSLSDSSTEYEDAPKKKKKWGTRNKDSSEDEYKPPRVVRAQNFVDDDEDEEGQKEEKPRKNRKRLQSSSEDEPIEAKQDEKQDEKQDKNGSTAKTDEAVSSDDWSSLSSNAEESSEGEASDVGVTENDTSNN